jgi:hypothetical protein
MEVVSSIIAGSSHGKPLAGHRALFGVTHVIFRVWRIVVLYPACWHEAITTIVYERNVLSSAAGRSNCSCTARASAHEKNNRCL